MPSGFGAALVAAVTVSLGSSLWPFLFVSAGKPLNTVTLMLRQFDFFAQNSVMAKMTLTSRDFRRHNSGAVIATATAAV